MPEMNKQSKVVYAEDVPYWKTSQSSADAWLDKTKREITDINGKILAEAFGVDATGKSAFMLAFGIGADQFKLVWPVLPSKTGNSKAAKVQAATMLYHDVKAKVVTAKVMGIRAAFFNYLMLPNGQTASEASSQDFLSLVPQMMSIPPKAG
jgi:hypothetical protein